jgi:glutathione synthase/RimK-type ligase-like ATP-grasp enzyme
MAVALATCTRLPEPDPDEALLVGALERAGVDVELVAWDGPEQDWARFALCVIRSTWNYVGAHEAFCVWADRVARATTLWNPPAIVHANTHKSYLRALATRDIPIVPTAWVPAGARPSLRDLLDARGWDDVVVKPQVGAGSYGCERFRRDHLGPGEAFLARWADAHDMMVQPFVPGIEEDGERACVFVDGEFTHAVRKRLRLAGDVEEASEALPLADDERALAERVLRPWWSELLYGRVDLCRDAEGRAMVMEVELVEPSLYLLQCPHALERLVEGIRLRTR